MPPILVDLNALNVVHESAVHYPPSLERFAQCERYRRSGFMAKEIIELYFGSISLDAGCRYIRVLGR